MHSVTDTPATTDPPPRPSRAARITRLARFAGRALAVLFVLATALWALLALAFAALPTDSPRTLPPLLLLAAYVAIWRFLPAFNTRVAASLVLFLCVLFWFLGLQPTHHRNWAIEHLHHPFPAPELFADNPSLITLHNFRNFDHTTTPSTPRWETRTFDLDRVATVDFLLVDFGAHPIAHTMLSFGFDDGQYLCVSIESRRERHETYSPLRGLFRNYELIYIIGDERDLVRLRTDIRKETVYLYRTRTTPDAARALLLDFLIRANIGPAFYNTLTDNCTTGIRLHVRTVANAPFAPELLLPGLTDRYAYRHGLLDTSLPFADLRARSRLTPPPPDDPTPPVPYSQSIRSHLPP